MDIKKVLILEDEFINSMSLKLDIENLGYEVAGAAMSVDEALVILEQQDVDLAILDINVKGDKDGIWLAGEINRKYKIPFIFITGYGNKDIIDKAIKETPIAYLQKPYSPSELYSALQIAKLKIENSNNIPKNETIEAFAVPETEYKATEEVYNSNETSSNHSDSSSDEDHDNTNNVIFQKNGDKVEKIIISEIIYIVSDKNYIKLMMKGKKETLIRGNLKDWLNKLEKYNSFIQVHRSYIINHSYIDSIRRGNVYLDEYRIPISAKYKDDLYKLLDIQH